MDRLFASPVMVSAPDEEWEIYTLRRTLVQSFRCSIIPLAIVFRSENPAGSFEFGCAGARRLPYLSAQYDCALRLPKLADMMGGSPMAREVTGRSKAIPAARLLALALGAAAFGAVAIGALAIGRLAVGRFARCTLLNMMGRSRDAPARRSALATNSSRFDVLRIGSVTCERCFCRLKDFRRIAMRYDSKGVVSTKHR